MSSGLGPDLKDTPSTFLPLQVVSPLLSFLVLPQPTNAKGYVPLSSLCRC